MATDYSKRCPKGHTDLRTRVGTKKRPGIVTTKNTWVRIAAGDYYCQTCKQAYESDEIEEREPSHSNVDRGYVWSPSHDEADA